MDVSHFSVERRTYDNGTVHHALLVSERAVNSVQGQKSEALIERPDGSHKMTVDLLTVT
jgi:hypothetical protein